jgi:hypothetical protein
VTTFFIDESKTKTYVMVAAVVEDGDRKALRKTLSALRMKGERRIHFASEGNRMRNAVLGSLIELNVKTRVFEASGTRESQGREACLVAMVAHAQASLCRQLVFERDQSIEKVDRRILFREMARVPPRQRLGYEFCSPHDEPLLWIADAVAWSYARGGDWRRRVAPLIEDVASTAG